MMGVEKRIVFVFFCVGVGVAVVDKEDVGDGERAAVTRERSEPSVCTHGDGEPEAEA